MKSIQYETPSSHTYLNRHCPFRLGYNENMKESSYNWHTNLEIIYVTKGFGTIRCEDDYYHLREGTVFVVNPDTLHYVYSDSGISFYFILIDEQFFTDNGFTLEQYAFHPVIHDSRIEKNFIKTINAIEQLIENENEINIAKSRLETLSLLVNICSDYSLIQNTKNKEKSKGSNELIKEAIKYINLHYTEAITLEQISNFLGITKYYLVREFKKYTNQTIFSYINLLRCKKAEMLLASGKNITETAYESGFESASYFTRTYKKIRGYAPSEYKKNCKNKNFKLEICSS
ncbi:MAG: AraC family transcriptional regulator [Ruminococcaceae bacterium]|nr:AraC family transcriptional regulator [Oscillospiraceae bacterium]